MLMTNEQVAKWILEDGLGETIENGLSSQSIEDPILAEKWEQCSRLMEQIYYILEEELALY